MAASRYLLAGAVVLVALTAHANTVSVNGSCTAGNCSNPDVIVVPPGATVQSPFSFLYTLANSDQYPFSGEVEVAPGQLTPRENVTALTVTYLGNASGGVSGNDVLTAEFAQQFFFEGRVMPHNEEERISGRFGAGVGGGSSISGQFTFGADAFPLLGPFSRPPEEFFASALGLSAGGGPLLEYWEYVLQFGEGSTVGSSVAVNSVVVPEPSSLMLLAIGALAGGIRNRLRESIQTG